MNGFDKFLKTLKSVQKTGQVNPDCVKSDNNDCQKFKIALCNALNIILENNIYERNQLQYEIGLSQEDIEDVLSE